MPKIIKPCILLIGKKFFSGLLTIYTKTEVNNMISITPYNINQNSSQTLNFNGRRRKIVEEVAVNITNVDAPDIHLQSKKLIIQATDLINETWAKIKAKKSHKNFPEFIQKDYNGSTVTLKPVYNNENLLLLEVDKGKVIDKIFVNQTNPTYFKYEQAVKTDFGTATTKTYNSKVQKNNPLLVERVNATLRTYRPKFLNNKKKVSGI